MEQSKPFLCDIKMVLCVVSPTKILFEQKKSRALTVKLSVGPSLHFSLRPGARPCVPLPSRISMGETHKIF